MPSDLVPLSLSPQSIHVISQALHQAPWVVANPVIMDLQKQVNAYVALKSATPQPELKLVNRD